MNEIMGYSFTGKEIRAITDKNGKSWFVAKDVCDILAAFILTIACHHYPNLQSVNIFKKFLR